MKNPIGVKIISVLYYIGAAVFLSLIVGPIVEGLTGLKIPMVVLPLDGGLLFLMAGIEFLALAVLSFFIARGLWKAQKWARIVAIIFATLGVLMAIFGMVKGQIGSNVVGLLINTISGGYLLLSSSVKKAFA